MTKLFFRLASISAGKFIRVDFSSNSVNTYREIMVSNRGVPCFDCPKRLRQAINSSCRVENNFCTVQPESQPMKRVVSAIADVYRNFPKFSLKNWVPRLAFHVIAWFVKIAHSRNVSFLLFAKNISVVVNHYRSVMKSSLEFFSLQNRRDNYHIVFTG